ncbi:MAG: hypothetical protein RLZZ127_1825 [Planctomycetota bacterium]|jgi:phosphoesterase RecJ-like protein
MSYARAAAAIRAAKTITLTTHVGPDGDGIGSCLALAIGLRRLGKTVRLAAPSKLSPVYAFLPAFSRFRTVDEEAAAAKAPRSDLLLSCDCGDLPRLGACGKLRRGTLINLDHHATNDRFGDINLVDEAAASSGVVVEALLRRLGVALDHDLAVCLYTTIVYDTGRFMHSNTTAAVLRWSAKLLDAGIDAALINRKLTYTRTEAEIRAQSVAMARLVRDADQPALAGIALDRATIEGAGDPDDWGDLVEIPRSIAGVEVSYVLKEKVLKDGTLVTRASLRANPPFRIAPVAQAFGGGGHEQAAGCTIPGGIAAALPRILPMLREACVPAKAKRRR